MPPRHIALLLGLCLSACTQAGTANEARLGKLSVQLDKVHAQLEDLTARMTAIDGKLDVAESARAAILEAARNVRPSPVRPRSSAPRVDLETLTARVSCKDDRCTIERRLLDELMANPESLARSARVVPTIRDDVQLGFKLYGIRPKSLPKLLGFRNADLVTSIGGRPLASLDSAMESCKGASEAKRFDVAYERRGESKTLTIVVK